MHPIERLRYVARAGDADPVLLAEEAAEALGYLAHDPRALVPACRRLLEAHPSCGPLWWVAARLLVADDVAGAAQIAIDELAGDPTLEELAATIPAAATVSIPARTSIADAVSMRPDLTVMVAGTPYRTRHVLNRIGDSVDVLVIEPDEIDEVLEDVRLIVTEALAAGPDGYLLDREQVLLSSAAERSGAEEWVVAGVATVLPQALFAAARASVVPTHTLEAADDEDDDLADFFMPMRSTAPRRSGAVADFRPAAVATAVVGPTGAQAPGIGLRQARCGAPPELLAR